MDVRSVAFSLGGLALGFVLIESAWHRWQARHGRLRVRLEPVPDVQDIPVQGDMVGAVRITRRDSSVDEVPVLDPESAALEQQDLFADEVVVMPPGAQAAAAVAAAPEQAQAREPELVVDDYIVIHVLPRAEAGMSGQLLLQAAVRYGLHFGEMKVFYRHEHPNGHGEVLFGMTHAVEPGYFELDTLARGVCMGVSFFQTLPGVQSIAAFDLMIDTARRLAQDLDAQLFDQDYHPLSPQLLEHLREKVQDYERGRRRQQGGPG